MIKPQPKKLLNKKDGQIAIVYSTILMIAMFCPVAHIESISPELNLDKCVHIILFAILYGTWLNAMKPYFQSQIKALQISIAFGLFTELIQGMLPYRSADPYDLLCDFIGVLFGFLIIKHFRKLKVNSEKRS